jgi:hypothetical protein
MIYCDSWPKVRLTDHVDGGGAPGGPRLGGMQ